MNTEKIVAVISATDAKVIEDNAKLMGITPSAFMVLIMRRCIHSYDAHGKNKIQEAMDSTLDNFDKLPEDDSKYHLTIHAPSEVLDKFGKIAGDLNMSTLQGLTAIVKALHVVGVTELLATA